jgi:CubicO group peptidase (beta-lactamase class C family)
MSKKLLLTPAAIAPTLPPLREAFSSIIRGHLPAIMCPSGEESVPSLAPAVGCAVVNTKTGEYGMHADGLRYFPNCNALHTLLPHKEQLKLAAAGEMKCEPLRLLGRRRPVYNTLELTALKNQLRTGGDGFLAAAAAAAAEAAADEGADEEAAAAAGAAAAAALGKVDGAAREVCFVNAEEERWHFGSNFKSFTAVALVRCILEPRGLRPDALTVEQVLGGAMKVPEALKATTMQMLLDHRSGLDDRIDVYDIHFSSPRSWARIWRSIGSPYQGAQEMWREFRFDLDPAAGAVVPPAHVQRSMVFERLFERWNGRDARRFTAAVTASRGNFIYSNFGVLLATVMAERILATSPLPPAAEPKGSSPLAAPDTFEGVMQRDVFAPLGMSTAGFGEPYAAVAALPGTHRRNALGHDHDLAGAMGMLLAAAPHGHSRLNYWEIAPPNATCMPQAFAPMGNMHCSLLDFLRWSQYQVACIEHHVAEKRAALKIAKSGSDVDAVAAAVRAEEQKWRFYDTSAAYTSPMTAGTPWTSYSSGLIRVDELAQRRAQLGGKQRPGIDAPREDVTKMFAEHWLHDGSTGAWHALHFLVPRRHCAGVIVANTSNMWLPNAMMVTLRQAMLDMVNA